MLRRTGHALKLKYIYFLLLTPALAAPLAGYMFLRHYDKSLLIAKEEEIIGRAAVVASVYKHAVLRISKNGAPEGIPVPEQYTEHADSGAASAEAGAYKNGVLPPVPSLRRPDFAPAAVAVRAARAVEPMIRDAAFPEGSAVFLLDYNGIILSEGKQYGLSPAHIAETGKALTGAYASALRIARGGEGRNGVMLHSVYPAVHGSELLGAVYVAAPVQTAFNVLSDAPAGAVLLMLATALFMLAPFAAVFSSLGRPLARLDAYTASLCEQGANAAALAPPPQDGAPDEIARLSQRFAGLSEKLREQSAFIGTFAEKLAFACDAPLKRIDNALKTDRPEAAAEAVSETGKLRAVLDGMSALARAEYIAASDRAPDVEKVTAKIRARFAENGPEILYNNAKKHLPLIDEGALEALLTRLCENAAQAGATLIKIDITRARNGEDIALYVTDNGKGVSEETREHLFTPFYSSKNSAGLGLCIVRAIAEACRGGASCERPENGARFKITLPKAA